MSEFLLQYKKVEPTTWAYLSSLLLVAIYFKFNRFWSVRNLDLILALLLVPGLLMVNQGQWEFQEATLARKLLALTEVTPGELPIGPISEEQYEKYLRTYAPQIAESLLKFDKQWQREEIEFHYRQGTTLAFSGFLFLLAISGTWLLRLLLDPTMVRRPLLEPNLTTGGLVFLGTCLFMFLMANVITGTPTEYDLEGPRGAEAILNKTDPGKNGIDYVRHGPGFYLVSLFPSISTIPLVDPVSNPNQRVAYATAAKVMAILSHLAVVAGLVLVGYLHFDNIKTGVGAAVMYLLIPYTALMTGQIYHVLPAALLLWAVVLYRRPFTAGIFIGLAMGVCYYPFFLLPLWLSFYWHRGRYRFALGVFASVAAIALSLVFVSENLNSYVEKIRAMFGLWTPVLEGLEGIWHEQYGWPPVYRLPILAAFVILAFSMVAWPAQKNLGTLLSCSAAIMVAAQFWHGYGGGLHIGWYLPLLILTLFRPNLEDRVASTVLTEAWLSRTREQNK